MITELEHRSGVAFVSFISKITPPKNCSKHSLEFITADYISYWKPVTAITRKSIIKWMWFGFPQKLDTFHSKTDKIQRGTLPCISVSSSQHFLSVQFVWNNSTQIFTTKFWSDSVLSSIQKHIYIYIHSVCIRGLKLSKHTQGTTKVKWEKEQSPLEILLLM